MYSNDFVFFDSIFTIIITLFIGFFIFIFINGILEWSKNNNSPILIVDAKLVTKRANHSGESTSYYITFEVESGDRIEFRVSRNEYGMLADGDVGKLTFQGTRYKSFQRNIN